MPEEITNGVEAMEGEAERMLAEAKTRAGEILLAAKDEAKKILSSRLVLDEVKTECDKIVSKAKAEADRKIKDSQKEAKEIETNADKKAKEITELVVNIVRGKG